MPSETEDKPITHNTEKVRIDDVRPHPRNYRVHTEDQLEHVMRSIKEHGFYRNVVIARDGTILAGHGVVQAARRMGMQEIPVMRLDVAPDDPQALKVLTGDNEIGRLAEVNDRALTEILKEIKDDGIEGLLGTGFDEMMLANLVFVTRPESEVTDFDAAAEWVGMPEFEAPKKPFRITISFETREVREEFLKKFYDGEVPGSSDRIVQKLGDKHAWTLWWPPKEKDDVGSVIFDDVVEDTSNDDQGGN